GFPIPIPGQLGDSLVNSGLRIGSPSGTGFIAIPKGRKSAKGEPSVHKDSLFDEIPKDTLDYMETEDAQDVGRSRYAVNEEKENADAEVSTEDVLSTAQQKVSTDTPKVSTNGSKFSTDKEKVSTDTPKVSTNGSKVSTDKEKLVLTHQKLVLTDSKLVPTRKKIVPKGQMKVLMIKLKKEGLLKMIARKKPRKQLYDDSDDEHRKYLVTFEGTLDSEIIEKKSVIARLDKVSSPDGDYLVLYRANGNFRAFTI
ncbi:hypothetical protein Tco_0873328, partial [Tanacetum coccineum]